MSEILVRLFFAF